MRRWVYALTAWCACLTVAFLAFAIGIIGYVEKERDQRVAAPLVVAPTSGPTALLKAPDDAPAGSVKIVSTSRTKTTYTVRLITAGMADYFGTAPVLADRQTQYLITPTSLASAKEAAVRGASDYDLTFLVPESSTPSYILFGNLRVALS